MGWSPKTAQTHAGNFKYHLLPAFGDRTAASVTSAELDRFYRKLDVEQGLSPSFIHRLHSQIRAMYNWSRRKGLIDVNPALAADAPTGKGRQLEIPSMTDVRLVQDAASPDFSVFVQLAATTGARRGTLVALRWGGINLDRGIITFTRSIADSVDGPVEKGTEADRPYSVSIGAATVEMLRVHRGRAVERTDAVGVKVGPRSFVFSDDGGVNHWSLGWPSHAWERTSAKVGIIGLRLHDLRHTAASQMLMAGIPVSIVAERLGCTEANIFRTYRHFIPGSDQTAAELMDRLLAGGKA